MSTEDLDKYVAKIIKDAKDASCMSIGKIAEGVGKDDKTVSNWIKGKSVPSVSNLIRLFQVMQQPLSKAILPAIFPHLEEIHDHLTVDQKRRQMETYIRDMALDSEIEKLYFLTFGSHGSSWYPQLEEWIALDHLPMKDRVSIAKVIENDYEIASANGSLIATDQVLPNMGTLSNAIEQGKIATISGRNAYNPQK